MKKVIVLIGICNFWIITLISGQCVAGDCQGGLGGYIYENGDKYIGEFKNGKREGVGYLMRADGMIYQGYFLNDKDDICGSLTLETGDKLGGLIANGEFRGYAYIFTVSPVLLVGSYYNSNGVEVPFDETNQEHVQSKQKFEMLDKALEKRLENLEKDFNDIAAKMGL
jgi:outer membrane protease